jgi:phosphoadenosine phosphosulfate reductase
MTIHNISLYEKEIEQLNEKEILKWAFDKFKSKVAIVSALGPDTIIIIDIAHKLNIPLEVITIDTGRLAKETYDLINEVENKYKMRIRKYFPDYREIEYLVNKEGLFSFRDSVQKRKECCKIRKINPLKRALKDKVAWISGVRKDQSITRLQAKKIEFTDNFEGHYKINPLLNWTKEMVWKYIKENNVPYNKLHDIGYTSIGCAPCTRAIKKGEDTRAGRWWWEDPEQKECGLHQYCMPPRK